MRREAPQRRCIACRKAAPRDELIRLVASEGGADAALRVDLLCRAAGRGRWVHPRPACLKVGRRRRGAGAFPAREEVLRAIEGARGQDEDEARRQGWLDEDGAVLLDNRVTRRLQRLTGWRDQLRQSGLGSGPLGASNPGRRDARDANAAETHARLERG